MSKISEVGMAENQAVGDMERWKGLEREAATRAATLHSDLRAIAETLGVVGVADEKRLREEILKVIAKRGVSPTAEMPAEPGYLPHPGVLGDSGGLGGVQSTPGGLEEARRVLSLPYGKVFNQRGHCVDEGWLIGGEFGRYGLAILQGREHGTNWEEGVYYYPRGSRFEAEEDSSPVSPETSERLRHLGFGGRP